MRIAALVLLALLAAGCGGSTTTGSGHVTTTSRDVSGFTSVDLEGAGTLTVDVGRPAALTISGDDNVLPIITTRVRDGVLVISSKHGYSTHHELKIRVVTPALDGMKLAGSGTIVGSGIRATAFSIELDGTGTVVLSGTAGSLDATVSGVGSAQLDHLDVRDAQVTVSGTGTVLVHVTGSLDASVDGVGSIVYSGGPRTVSTHVSGLGSIAGN
jgi:Putative auto-transporter adhesin, head GIN domain